MHRAIREFPKQFEYEPRIEGNFSAGKYQRFLVTGMGGSHLPADLVMLWNPALDMVVYSDYGLPPLPQERWRERLVVALSYSGNTEEAIDGFHEARKRELPLISIATGGKLIELSKTHGVPYILMPDIGIQPRSGSGFSVKALLKAMGDETALKEISKMAHLLNPSAFENEGKTLADALHDHVPLVYASRRNFALAYTWKIRFNETGKNPAFCNVFPELPHNEINGFDSNRSIRKLTQTFRCIFLRDEEDHPRIIKRMKVLERVYADRKLGVEMVAIAGENIYHKVFNSLLLADWTAYYTAEGHHLESEPVPMVEEFKKLMEQ